MKQEKKKISIIVKIAVLFFILLTIKQCSMISNIMSTANSNISPVRNYKKHSEMFKKYTPIINQAISQNYSKGLYEALKTGAPSLKFSKACTGACPSPADKWSATSRTEQVYFGGDNGCTFFYKDGITIMFPKASFTEVSCLTQTAQIPECTGAIDLNGKKEPNKIVMCDDGTTNSDSCNVSVPTDVYQISIYNGAIHPATQASNTVFTTNY